MTTQAIFIGIIFAILIAIFGNRPSRGFIGMTFKALVCFLSLLVMGFGRKRPA